MKSIVWSGPAIEEFQNIMEYWDNKTKSESYSKRIPNNTDSILKLVQDNHKWELELKLIQLECV